MRWIDWCMYGLAVAFIIGLFALMVWDISTEPKYAYDHETQRAVFRECMEALPAGPNETVYNDWSEVVDECRSYAAGISRYCYEDCPPEKERPQ